MHEAYADDFCRVRAKDLPDETQKTVLLSFTGIGHAMGGINVQKIEFFGTGRTFDNVLFIDDLQRSWGNALDFPTIFAAIRPYLEGRRVCSIGNSMGGFLGVVASAFWEIEMVVAFASQFSVSRAVIPQEERWQKFTRSIKEFRIPSLEGYFNDTTRYFLFSGGAGREHLHWSRFPKKDNVSNVVFAGVKHNLASTLKEEGSLPQIIDACFGGRFDVDWLNGITAYPARRV